MSTSSGRYLVWTSCQYYPGGALEDFVARTDDVDATIAAHEQKGDWFDVYDIETGEWTRRE